MKERPEFTRNYPAVDGIAKEMRNERPTDLGGTIADPAEEPIRSDVLQILQMPDSEFNAWFRERSAAVLKLLDMFQLAGDVPDLSYGGEKQRPTVGYASTRYRSITEDLERAKEYLEIIKQVREEN